MFFMNEQLIRDEYKNLTSFLIKNNISITTMESATSGQIASLITDTEGASKIFKGAFITYSNEAKIMNGVPAQIIEKYSVYSKETVTKMAEACRKTYNADVGIGVSGTIGNVDPANIESSVPGEVYFAIATKTSVSSYVYSIEAENCRLYYKLKVADLVYKELRKILNF